MIRTWYVPTRVGITLNVYHPSRPTWGSKAFETFFRPVERTAVRFPSTPTTHAVVPFEKWCWIPRSRPFRYPVTAGSSLHPTVSSYSPTVTCSCAEAGRTASGNVAKSPRAMAKTKTLADVCMEFRGKRHSPPVCLFWHKSRGLFEEGESLKAVHGLPADGWHDARPVGNRERDPGDHPVVHRRPGLPADPIPAAPVRIPRLRRLGAPVRRRRGDSFRGRRRSHVRGDGRLPDGPDCDRVVRRGVPICDGVASWESRCRPRVSDVGPVSPSSLVGCVNRSGRGPSVSITGSGCHRDAAVALPRAIPGAARGGSSTDFRPARRGRSLDPFGIVSEVNRPHIALPTELQEGVVRGEQRTFQCGGERDVACVIDRDSLLKGHGHGLLEIRAKQGHGDNVAPVKVSSRFDQFRITESAREREGIQDFIGEEGGHPEGEATFNEVGLEGKGGSGMCLVEEPLDRDASVDDGQVHNANHAPAG